MPPDESIPALAAALEIDVADLTPPEPAADGPATVVISSPITPPPAPAPPEEPPTIVQPTLPVAGDADRPPPTRPPARPEPAVTPPSRPPTRPAEVTPAPPRPSTEREDAEPWIHFETQAMPAPVVTPPPARIPVVPPAAQIPITDQPTQEVVAPPPPMPQPPPQPRVEVVQPKSYLEDPKQRILYGIRMLLTLAFLGIMAIVLVWAVGEFLSVMSDALDLFSDTTEATTPTPAPVP